MTNQQYSRARVQEMIESARKRLDELPERRKECKEAGHHLDYREFPYMITNRSNPLRDSVKGVCHHCLTFCKRPLNERERREADNFFASLRDHILY